MAVPTNTCSCSLLNLDCNVNLKKNLRETQLRPLSPTNSWLKSSNSGGIKGLGITKRERSTVMVNASCFFNPTDQPILKEALKEPVAFMGGIFAGLLRLDLEEEPLKEWVTRTVEASGITVEDNDAEELQTEEVPQQIEIE